MKRKNMTRSERKFMFSSPVYKATHKPRERKKKLPVVMDTKGFNLFSYDNDGNFVKAFANIAEAKALLEVSDVSHIYKVLNGKRRIAFGYKWSKEYIDCSVVSE